jgi:hypothetical protein
MWIGSVVTAVIGAILTYKTAKDRSFALPMWYLAIVQKVKTWRSTK